MRRWQQEYITILKEVSLDELLEALPKMRRIVADLTQDNDHRIDVAWCLRHVQKEIAKRKKINGTL